MTRPEPEITGLEDPAWEAWAEGLQPGDPCWVCWCEVWWEARFLRRDGGDAVVEIPIVTGHAQHAVIAWEDVEPPQAEEVTCRGCRRTEAWRKLL